MNAAIVGSGCALWPPYKADSLRLRNAAKLREVPMDTWKSYPVRRVMFKPCKYIYFVISESLIVV